MTLDRPYLTAEDVHLTAAAAFAPGTEQLWGLEVETLVCRPGEPTARPGVAELPSVRTLPGGSTVTVEPGGQLEISTPPLARVDDALDVAAADEAALACRLADAGLAALPGAVDDRRPPWRVLELPRYRAMESFFDAGGPYGRRMMCNTASLQLNLSHHPTDPASRWHLVHQLGPVLVALFAASPGTDLAGTPWRSVRQRVWAGTDPRRTAPVDAGGDPATEWARYALAADVMLVRTPDGVLRTPPGTPFARWMAEGHPTAGHPGIEDLVYHLSTLFPPVRPRGWIELRMLDALPPVLREVVTLVLAAAVQEPVAQTLAALLPDTSGWWRDAARHGLAHPGLAGAATTLLDEVLPSVPTVTSRPERVEAVAAFRDRVAREVRLLTRSG